MNVDDAACPTACTSDAEFQQNVSLEALAAMLMNLSPEDRAALAKKLSDGSVTPPEVHHG